MPEPIDARVFRGVCFALLFEAAALIVIHEIVRWAVCVWA